MDKKYPNTVWKRLLILMDSQKVFGLIVCDVGLILPKPVGLLYINSAIKHIRRSGFRPTPMAGESPPYGHVSDRA
jgi:hypothetical protein